MPLIDHVCPVWRRSPRTREAQRRFGPAGWRCASCWPPATWTAAGAESGPGPASQPCGAARGWSDSYRRRGLCDRGTPPCPIQGTVTAQWIHWARKQRPPAVCGGGSDTHSMWRRKTGIESNDTGLLRLLAVSVLRLHVVFILYLLVFCRRIITGARKAHIGFASSSRANTFYRLSCFRSKHVKGRKIPVSMESQTKQVSWKCYLAVPTRVPVHQWAAVETWFGFECYLGEAVTHSPCRLCGRLLHPCRQPYSCVYNSDLFFYCAHGNESEHKK